MSLPPYIAPNPTEVRNYLSKLSWGVSDLPRFIELIVEASKLASPGIYFGDNIFTWGRNNSMFDDLAFRKAWEDNIINEADRTIVWRRYVLATMAFHAINCDGDFVECGVYQGSAVKTVVDYLGGKAFPKTFWAYDTFDYHPVEGHAFDGQTPGFYEKVRQRFSGYDQVKLVKGVIPEVFVAHCPEKIAFLHIDLNSAAAETATLEALFDQVVPGGVIIFDDYEWSGAYRPQKLAEDPWLDARQYKAVPLPTGQAFVIKR
ncbi:MAG: TylF/MycF/NovP-related O-methyltransferase [Rhodospirillaceae bacterium]